MCERNSRESVSAGVTINLRRAIRGVMLLMLVEMIVTRSAIFPHLGGHTGRRRPLSVPPTRRSCQKWFQKWHHRFKTLAKRVFGISPGFNGQDGPNRALPWQSMRPVDEQEGRQGGREAGRGGKEGGTGERESGR